MGNHFYIACDLGAESGRVMVGQMENGRLEIEEIHRFSTGAHRLEKSWRWDLDSIEKQLVVGLKCAAERQAKTNATVSISVDSWGVDTVLMREGKPLSLWPFHYRDERTAKIFAEMSAQEVSSVIFAETGLQFLDFNTLYQLLAERQQSPENWREADGFLLIADYFLFRFSGVALAERSLASTTQLYNPRLGDWSARLQSEFALSPQLFPPLCASGTQIGELLPDWALETGLVDAQIVASCAHDTAAAVAAVPGEGNDWAYLSSGTWSLLGVELPAPLINKEVRRAGFTNEVGFGGTTRLLKNIVGLWIVQECRRYWENEGISSDYAVLTQQAAQAPAFRCLIRPDALRFASPGEMPRKIEAFCRETGQNVPQTPGQFVRCILESLALLYRQTLEKLEFLTGSRIARLHIVGGGSRSALLNELTASAIGRDVVAGPVEATAIGNLLVQSIALGHLDSLQELRQVVRTSFPVQIFKAQEPILWQGAYERFSALKTL